MPRRPCNDLCYQRVTLASGAPRRPDPARRPARMSTGGGAAWPGQGRFVLLRPWESCTPPRRRGRERGETRCNVSPACSHREAVESLVTRRCPDVRGGLSRQLLQSGILVPLRGGGGGPAGAPPPLAVRTPATGSHSPAREEEFSHRRTQQGSLSRGGEVSTGPCPTRSEECRAKGHAARSPRTGCALSLSFPLGVPLGVSAQPPTPHIW